MPKLETTKLVKVMAIPPPPYIFEGLMRDKSLTLLSAKSGSRKTFVMMAMAIAMDYELPLFGCRKPTRMLKPLILAGDSPDWDIGQQSTKVMNGYKLTPEQQGMCEIEGIFRAGNHITNPEFLKAIRQYHAEEGFDTMFVDCHRKYFNGSENDSDGTAQAVALYQGLRDDLGIAIVLAHHWGKPKADGEYSGNDRARGSTALVDGVDFHFTLEQNGPILTLEAAKHRGHIAATSDRIRIEVIESPDSVEFKELTMDIEAMVKQLLDDASPTGCTRKFICEALQPNFETLSPKQLYKLVDNAIEALKRANKAESIERGLWRSTGK